jgi:hypothetical protein
MSAAAASTINVTMVAARISGNNTGLIIQFLLVAGVAESSLSYLCFVSAR